MRQAGSQLPSIPAALGEPPLRHPVRVVLRYCIDRGTPHSHHLRVRVLTHIKKLDDCFGQFLVRAICPCGTTRDIEPEALARLVGWSATLASLAPRLRCSKCGRKDAEVVAVARPRPRPRGVPKNPH